jgi:hypothetical protein
MVSKDEFKNRKMTFNSENNTELNQELKGINFKNQFNHRGMIRKPKEEGKKEVIYIKLVQNYF